MTRPTFGKYGLLLISDISCGERCINIDGVLVQRAVTFVSCVLVQRAVTVVSCVLVQRAVTVVSCVLPGKARI